MREGSNSLADSGSFIEHDTFQSCIKPLSASPIAMEAVAVHPDMVTLAIVLLVLCLAIIILGVSLLVRRRGQTPFEAESTQNPTNHPDTTASGLGIDPRKDATDRSDDFVFRPNLARDLARPPTKNAATATPPPERVAFSTIQHEIRAALEAAARETNHDETPGFPLLNWAEPDRLAVLSLGDADPQTAWPLLQEQGIHILVVPEDHPFPLPNRTIELLRLPNNDETLMPSLVAGLRAKLTKGERIAFYTETGLTGQSALLAARLNRHNG